MATAGARDLLPIQQPLVLAVVADPEPNEIGTIFHGDGAEVDANTHRPKPTGLLQSQRRVFGVVLEQNVVFVGNQPN
ncbi:MAG: hypothetical protein ACKOHG_14890 [Planctomycetia bacterium]